MTMTVHARRPPTSDLSNGGGQRHGWEVRHRMESRGCDQYWKMKEAAMVAVSCCPAQSWRAEGKEQENERASASDRDSEAALRDSSLRHDDMWVRGGGNTGAWVPHAVRGLGQLSMTDYANSKN
jgi:hypothetical protein